MKVLLRQIVVKFGRNLNQNKLVFLLLAVIGLALVVLGVYNYGQEQLSEIVERKSFFTILLLVLSTLVTSQIVFESTYRLSDYRLLTRLPVPAKSLFVYISLKILFRLIIVIAITLYFDFLLKLDISVVAMHARAIIWSGIISLLLVILSGYGNRSKSEIVDIIRKLLSRGLISETAFLYYAPGLATVFAFVPELYWYSTEPLLLSLIGGISAIILLLASYLLYIRRFLQIRVFTEDAWLQYNIQLGVGEGGPIFGQWLSKFLPVKLASIYLTILRVTRRRNAPAYHLMGWIPFILLFIWFVSEKLFISTSFYFSITYIIFSIFYLQRNAWWDNEISILRWPISPFQAYAARFLVLVWLHFVGGFFISVVLALGDQKLQGIWIFLLIFVFSILLSGYTNLRKK